MRTLMSSLAVLTITAGLAAQTTWHVHPGGSDFNSGTAPGPANAFLTITKANTVAATGDVIKLAAGTFDDEPGVLTLGDKGVMVLGEGMGNTIILAHAAATTNINTGFPNAPVATQQRAVVLIQGPNRVDFRALTIDGNFSVPGNGRLTGLYYRNGADGFVSDVEIKNCRRNPLANDGGCAGVVVRGDNAGNPCDVTLRNCYVHNWGKGGVVSFFNTNLEVENCRVVGSGIVGLGFPAQNGIQISFDAAGFIRNNTVTNCHYDDASFSATGILCYDAFSAVDISDNNIGGCELGISCTGLTNNNTPTLIQRNRVHCARFCIEIIGLVLARIEDNQFHASEALAMKVASDDGNNMWLKNSYSDYSGVGAYAVSGGAAVDNTPRNTVDMVGGTPVTTLLTPTHVPVGMVVGQFDGLPGDDFVTLEQNLALSISAGLNIGAAFAVTNVPILGAINAAPVAIVAGNFDANAGTDIAVLTTNISPATTQNRIYMFTNVGGTGTFVLATVTVLSGFNTATGMAAGNIDGDGDTDLVVTNATGGGAGSAAVMVNNGAGVFTQVALPGPFTKPVRGAVIARINADAFADIALIEGDAGVGRLHRLAGNGTPVFTAFGGSPEAIGVDPTAIKNFDFDGDFDQDLLIAFGLLTGGAVDTFVNNGVGVFTSMRCRVDGSATGLAVGNLDNDNAPGTPNPQVFGDAAVVNFNGGSVTVLGNYVKGAGFGAGGLAVQGATPSAAAFGNFDGNLFQDLFYCDANAATVVVLPGKVQARNDWYGFGCPGIQGRIPYIRATGAAGATQPNLSYGLQVFNARPFSLAGISVCGAPQVPLVPCFEQVDVLGSQIFAILFFTDANGQGGFGLPLPATPVINGLSVFAEGAVFDPAAALLYGLPISLTNGLKIRIGD